MYDRSRFKKGADVYSSDNEKIGTVSDVGPNFLHVTTGFLGLGQDLFIPFDAVSNVTENRVTLNVPKDRVSDMGWTQKPAATAAAGREEMYGPRPAAAAERTVRSTLRVEDLPGYELFSSDQKDLGKISNVEQNCLHVSSGLLGMGRDLYIPIDAVDYCTKDRCFLKVTADQIQSKGWTQPCGQAAMPQRGAAAPEHGERTIPLREEELEAHRRREQAGEVIISKDVVQEERTMRVPVTHDEVTIERRAVDEDTTQAPAGGEVARIPIYEEEVEVTKHPHVREELIVSKESVTEEEPVRETVRREVPHIEETGKAKKFVREEGETEEEARARHEREMREGK